MGDLFDLRLECRAESGFLVRADVLDFYGSIYTHSIPWAVYGKVEARRRMRTRTDPLNELDDCIRNTQDGQTNGIDVGPDTSFVLAELVLSACDRRLQRRIPRVRGFRFYDDYELYTDSRDQAEHALAELESALAEYELSLNRSKTSIQSLPVPTEYHWAMDLKHRVRPISSQKEGLIALFEHAFRLMASGVDEHVMRYTIGLARKSRILPDTWTTYERLLWQASRAEASVLPVVLAEIVREHGRHRDWVDLELAGRVLNRHVIRNAPLGFTHEVAWAIWGLIALEQPLVRRAVASACESLDPIVAILTLMAHENGLTSRGFTSAAWQEYADPTALAGDHWLLTYEAGVRGWRLGTRLPARTWSGEAWLDQFESLRSSGISFLIDKFDYGEDEPDMDDEYIYWDGEDDDVDEDDDDEASDEDSDAAEDEDY